MSCQYSESPQNLPLNSKSILLLIRLYLFYNFKAKSKLIKSIDKFIQERIVLAGVAISETYARTKINDGDVILTYAWWVKLTQC